MRSAFAVCVRVHACVRACPQACALSSCHPDMVDGQAKHFCHSAFPSPARPSPLQICFPVTSFFLRLTHTHAPTFSINFSLAYTSHNQLHHALTLTSWGHITHQKKWPLFLGHMLEPVKCVAFPLPWRRINRFLFPADIILYNKSYVGKAPSKT